MEEMKSEVPANGSGRTFASLEMANHEPEVPFKTPVAVRTVSRYHGTFVTPTGPAKGHQPGVVRLSWS